MMFVIYPIHVLSKKTALKFHENSDIIHKQLSYRLGFVWNVMNNENFVSTPMKPFLRLSHSNQTFNMNDVDASSRTYKRPRVNTRKISRNEY